MDGVNKPASTPPNPSTTPAEQVKARQLERWKAQDELDKQIFQLQKDSHDKPVHSLRRFMAGYIKDPPPRPLPVPLPLSVAPQPSQKDPEDTLSISDSEYDPRLASKRTEHVKSEPAEPGARPRRKSSVPQKFKSSDPFITSVPTPAISSTPVPKPARDLPVLDVRPNVKPVYMQDVPWLPKLPPRHRWRRTYRVSCICS